MQNIVGDVMTRKVVAIDREASLEEAESLMEAHGVHRLPVVDDEGRLVGILSYGDLREATSLEAATTNPYAPEAEEDWITVGEAMSDDLVLVTEDTSLPDAVELLLRHKINGLPVVAALTGPGRQQLVGIVTDSDIFRLLLRLWRQEENSVP